MISSAVESAFGKRVEDSAEAPAPSNNEETPGDPSSGSRFIAIALLGVSIAVALVVIEGFDHAVTAFSLRRTKADQVVPVFQELRHQPSRSQAPC